jgi:O-antigen/teichoic acid export membrane protein
LTFVLLGQLNWVWLSATAFGYAAISGYNSVLDGMQNAARQRAIVAWHGALSAWGRFLGAVGLIILLGAHSAIAMLGYMLASMLVLLSQGWFLKYRLLLPNGCSSRALGDPRRWGSQMFTYAWPFASWGIFTWMQMASDRWALQIFTSTKQVGLYAVLYQLGYYPIMILSGLMVQLVMPVFFQYVGDACDTSRTKHVHRLIWQLTLASLIMTGSSVIVAMALHGFVFHLLVAPEYESVSWLLPGVVLAGGIFATGQFASLSVMSNKKTRTLLGPKIGSAVIGVALNLLGAAWFAVPGVVGASIVFSSIYSIWVYRLIKAQ